MGKHSFKMDDTDRQILKILQENAKITNAQLSKEIGLSPAPTLERVKKLETTGIIKSYHASIDTQKIGLGVTTLVHLSLVNHRKSCMDSFVNKIRKIDNVIECYHMTGPFDFVIKIITEDIAAYEKLMSEVISEIEEIANMQSTMILSTLKNNTALPIP